MAQSVFRIPALDGGYVTSVSPRLLDQSKGYAKTLRNIDLSAVGIPRKRFGVVNAGLPILAHSCLGVSHGLRTSWSSTFLQDDEPLILAAEDETVRNFFPNPTNPHWGVVVGTLEGLTPMNFLVYSDQVILANGSDASMIWDGSYVTMPTDFPVCSMMTEWRGRIVASGILDDPCLVHMCHAIDPTIWNPDALGSNAVKFYVGPDDGEPVTGILNTGEGGLLVGKPSQLYGIFGYTRQDMALDLLDRTIGVSSQRTMVYSRPYAYFCGREGVFRYSGNVPTKISEAIQTLWDDVIDKDNLDKATATLWKRVYLLTVPCLDSSLMTLAYHVDRERWMGIWDNPVMEFVSESNGEILYSEPGGDTLYTISDGTFEDKDEPYPAEIETHQLDFEVPEYDKGLTNAYVIFMCAEKPYSVEVSCTVDGSYTEEEPKTYKIVGAKGTQVVHRHHIGKTGRFFSFKIRSLNNRDFRPLAISLSGMVKELI